MTVCKLCGGDADDPDFDGEFVETPEGPILLSYNCESCEDCREDVVDELAARGLEQEGLGAFA